MVFVYTFAVGGGSRTVRPFPNWALVRPTFFFVCFLDTNESLCAESCGKP